MLLNITCNYFSLLAKIFNQLFRLTLKVKAVLTHNFPFIYLYSLPVLVEWNERNITQENKNKRTYTVRLLCLCGLDCRLLRGTTGYRPEFRSCCVTTCPELYSYNALAQGHWPSCVRLGSMASRLRKIACSSPPWIQKSASVRFLVAISATNRSLAQRSPSECGVSECDLETSTIERLCSIRTVESLKKVYRQNGQDNCAPFFSVHSRIVSFKYLLTYLFNYLLTYLFPQWRRVLLEKLQLIKKFPTFYGTPKFITVLTSARHLFLS